jgi:hypothetical protein
LSVISKTIRRGAAKETNMRAGQWCKFAAPDFPEAHHAADGKVVAIYRPAHLDPITREFVPELLHVVDEDGHNLQAVFVELDPVTKKKLGRKLQDVRLSPADVTGLEGIGDRADIPAARLATAPPEWQPTA